MNGECTLRLFADDALIYTVGYSSREVSDCPNEQMRRVKEWLNINKLLLNVDKTKVMLIRRARNKSKEDNIKIKVQNC